MSKARLQFVADVPGTMAAVGRLADKPWNQFQGGDLPQPVAIRVRVVEGRLVCTGLVIGAFDDREISARDLRRIALPDLLKLAGTEIKRRSKERGWKDFVDRPRTAELSPDTRYRPGRRPTAGWPREHFAQVARAYRAQLVANPFAPMKAMAEQLGTTEPTARRWVLRARDMGLLGRPMPGKAGAGDLSGPGSDPDFELEREDELELVSSDRVNWTPRKPAPRKSPADATRRRRKS